MGNVGSDGWLLGCHFAGAALLPLHSSAGLSTLVALAMPWVLQGQIEQLIAEREAWIAELQAQREDATGGWVGRGGGWVGCTGDWGGWKGLPAGRQQEPCLASPLLLTSCHATSPLCVQRRWRPPAPWSAAWLSCQRSGWACSGSWMR